MHWKKVIREALWVTLIALALACSAFVFRPKVLPIIPPEVNAAESEILPPEQDIAFITIDDAKVHFEQGTAIFTDARPRQAFNQGHIQGALHFDPLEFDDWSSKVYADIAPDQMVIAYCEGDQCSLSLDLAEKLNWLGYENVMVLKDGWGLWQSHGLPVDRMTNE